MTKKRTSKPAKRRGIPHHTKAPVTLAEALELAGVAEPNDMPRTARAAARRAKALPGQSRRARRGRSDAPIDPPSIQTIESERARFAAHRRSELQQRIRDYKATMRILKTRGVVAEPDNARQPRPSTAATKRTAAAALAARAVLRPLQVLAEGDSWFDYPRFFGGGIVRRLPGRIGVPVLSLANAGDEVRYMLGVEQRAELEAHLRDGCPAGGPWDVLLFSGGGNDIVGDPMTLWVRDYAKGKTAAELLHGARFDTALALVRAGYEDLITLRDRVSPTTHLVFHTYDFAIPDGRGVCGKGPWLRPTFVARGYPDTDLRFQVVQEMLKRFATLLKSLARAGSITVIDGQGLLPPGTGSWHNELHPSKRGYMAFADRFRDELRRLFPDRLP